MNGHAEKFFAFLAKEQCPDCGQPIKIQWLKEETEVGGDGLCKISCTQCLFDLTSRGEIHRPGRRIRSMIMNAAKRKEVQAGAKPRGPQGHRPGGPPVSPTRAKGSC